MKEKKISDLRNVKIFCVLRFLSLIFAAALLSFTWAELSWGNNGDTGGAANELIIQAKAGVSRGKLAGVLEGLGTASVGDIPQIRLKRIRVQSREFEKVKAALKKNPHIKFVEPNYIAEAAFIPNDAQYYSQWHLQKISASPGWDISTGSASVPIAIIDSGIDPTHPDLAGKLIQGYNFVGGNTDTHDVMGHGTAVAGSAAALSNNYIGVAGIAWQNPVMPLVVINSNNWATYYDVANAITYAADHGAKIINLSLAGSSSSSTLQNAVNYAWNKGAVIFAAAANNSTSTPYYPAACNNVVAVSATTSSDTLASFSNYGTWVDISAPGVSILTTTNGGAYSSWSGTSFSSPITAGLGALIMSVNPSLTNAQIVDIIEENADDLGSPGFDPYFGYGRINVYKSVLSAFNTLPVLDEIAPTVSITSPANASTVVGSVTVSVSATDNVGVSKVELYVNGTLYASDTTEPYSFLWDTSSLYPGYYDLKALAYDAAGNVGPSGSVTVYVSNAYSLDTIKPSVTILSPQNNTYVSRRVRVKAAASDNVGIKRVEFYIDGALKTTLYRNSTSYTWYWYTLSASKGAHTLMLKAFDEAGNIGTDSITVYK